MSNPQKGERSTASQPDAMRLRTEISSVFDETDTSKTQMPTGEMIGVGSGLTISDMPSGQMTAEASTGQMSGLTGSEMPRGHMTSALSATDNGLTVTAMPGQIQAGGQAEKNETDVFPVLEITGEWLLTLSPTSFKKSRGN